MTKIYSGASMSLDGYIAGPGESGFEHLFKWYGNGEHAFETTNPELTMRMTEGNLRYMREVVELTGAFVVGRHLFDVTNGWGGRHTLGKPCVVLTHSVPDGWERESEWFAFVTEGGIEAAVAKAAEIAGDRGVGVNAGQMASQALAAGLLDEVWIDLVPVVLGGGTPFFSGVDTTALEGPVSVTPELDVTHLRYLVNRR